MKNKLLISALFIATSLSGFCTVWTVNNSGTTFTPSSITITFGDTVNFVLAGSHNSVEVSQTTWNANGNTPLGGGFQTAFGGGQVLPAQLGVGTHYYVCSPHASMGMKGIIIVENCTIPGSPIAISGNTSVCPNSSNTYAVNPVSGATSYTWTLPGGWAGTSLTNSIGTLAGIAGGNITITANNFCGSSVAQTLAITVNTPPSSPGAISGNTTVCNGSSNTYSVSVVGGATSYSWTFPSGWSGSSSTNTILAVAGNSSGTISVTANNGCSSVAQTLPVTVNSAPNTPGTISGNTSICAQSTNSYTISLVNGATSYTWTLPNAWTGTSTTNSISATADANSGNISVIANNTCGSSAPQTLAITINSTPDTPGIISGNTSVCAESVNSYSIAPVSGATSYTWSLPSGWIGNSTTNSISATADATTNGFINVIANNVCGNSSPQVISVAIIQVDTMVNLSGEVLSANVAGGAYQWYNCLSNLPIFGEVNQSFIATSNGSYAVIITHNGCTDTSNCHVLASIGIADLGLENEINIYPNPTKDIIIIRSSGFLSSNKYSIFDQSGREVLVGILNDSTTSIDVKSLESGVYFVRIGESGRDYKMIKE